MELTFDAQCHFSKLIKMFWPILSLRLGAVRYFYNLYALSYCSYACNHYYWSEWASYHLHKWQIREKIDHLFSILIFKNRSWCNDLEDWLCSRNKPFIFMRCSFTFYLWVSLTVVLKYVVSNFTILYDIEVYQYPQRLMWHNIINSTWLESYFPFFYCP